MSEEQLKKLRAEREALIREEKLLKEAISVRDASDKVVAFTSRPQDPFNSPENDWTKLDNAGCCEIM